MNNVDLEKEVKKTDTFKPIWKKRDCLYRCYFKKQLNYLSNKDYDNWRFGRVEYLEKVCNTNLSKLTLINKLIRKYSTELGLKSSWTGYSQYGKGVKRRLRFSKSGEKTIEDRYATHYIDTDRIKELKEIKNGM